MRHRLVRYWLPPFLWMGVIFMQSSRSHLPSYPSPAVDFGLKKSGHIVAYATLAFLWWRALRQRMTRRTAVIWAFVATASYAISDEWHQTMVPNRNGTPMDVLIDLVGATVALWLVWRRSQ